MTDSELVLHEYQQEIAELLGNHDWSWYNSKISPSSNSCDGYWQLTSRGGGIYAHFTLIKMPGCCGICISTKAFVNPEHRGRGLGKLLNKIRMHMAKDSGYGLLMCTEIQANEIQRTILAKNGWTVVYGFPNPRTGNTVQLSVVKL